MGLRSLLNVNAALELASGPAPGARIVGVEGQAGTRGTADAGVALFIEGQKRNAMRFGVLPYIARRPLCKRTQLREDLTARKCEGFLRLKIRTRLRLFTAQAGDPRVIGGKGAKKRLHFAQPAAAIRGGLIKNAEFRFLFRNRVFGKHVDEVQIP